jgi:predicted secreted Zn-dependent protease
MIFAINFDLAPSQKYTDSCEYLVTIIEVTKDYVEFHSERNDRIHRQSPENFLRRYIRVL